MRPTVLFSPEADQRFLERRFLFMGGEAPDASPPEAERQEEKYEVKSGDHLWKIAEEHKTESMETRAAWQQIKEANPSLVSRNWQLIVGQKINLPNFQQAEAASDTSEFEPSADTQERLQHLEEQVGLSQEQMHRIRTSVAKAVDKGMRAFETALNIEDDDERISRIAELTNETGWILEGGGSKAENNEAAKMYRTEMVTRIQEDLANSRGTDVAGEILLAAMEAGKLPKDQQNASEGLRLSINAVREDDDEHGLAIPQAIKEGIGNQVPGAYRTELAQEMEEKGKEYTVDVQQINTGGRTEAVINIGEGEGAKEMMITGAEILTGAAMTNIDPVNLNGFEFHRVVERDGVYIGQMKNGCEGNLVIFQVEDLPEPTPPEEPMPEIDSSIHKVPGRDEWNDYIIPGKNDDSQSPEQYLKDRGITTEDLNRFYTSKTMLDSLSRGDREWMNNMGQKLNQIKNNLEEHTQREIQRLSKEYDKVVEKWEKMYDQSSTHQKPNASLLHKDTATELVNWTANFQNSIDEGFIKRTDAIKEATKSLDFQGIDVPGLQNVDTQERVEFTNIILDAFRDTPYLLPSPETLLTELKKIQVNGSLLVSDNREYFGDINIDHEMQKAASAIRVHFAQYIQLNKVN